jgi:putative CocE/NonD family hydrolase
MRRRAAILRSLLPVLLLACLAFSQEPPKPQEASQPERFNRQEVMVPMRDGVRLQTAIFTPKNAAGTLPILLTRTPYGVPRNERWVQAGNRDELIADGYIFVWQNLRGRFQSEGTFVMQRRPRDLRDPKATDESTDAWDTVDWLVKNVRGNNGRVGIYGVSYDGWTTTMALLGPHPAVKAASEQASPADMFLGDDFHHNGAFRLSYGFEYAALLETAKEANTRFQFDKYDTYEWYLDLGALSNANQKYFHGELPTWNDFVKHPNRDYFWRSLAFDSFLRITTVPNLNVAGWYDQEDFYGPVKVYELLEENDSRHLNYLVVGPWNHGGWWGKGERLGPVDFDSETGKYFRAQVQAPWFAYWLHDKGKLQQPEALAFQTGTNQWKSYAEWPPRVGVTERRLYFHGHRRLSFDAPQETGEAFDEYVSDPANPVPYRPRPVPPTYPGREWPLWLEQDQRFVDHRPDVLSWETEALAEDVVVTGEIVADLFASTSGTDSDWIVKLIDVYPEDYKAREEASGPGYPNAKLTGGYQLIVADEVFRGRFRNSFEKPEPIPANQALEYKFSLHTNNHAFLKGHKIMVQVQSTWFPLIDRNPQKFVDNIFQAKDEDYVKATQRIYRTKSAASSVILPVASQ